jgi:dihydropteroate synthase
VTRIVGIVNITRDSFSDGGRFLDVQAAIAHARALHAAGADLVELGAESTHPQAEEVPAEVEIERLTPVIQALRGMGIALSVDTYKAQVMRAVLALEVKVINDVTALTDPAAVAAVRDTACKLVIMHARRGPGGYARAAGALAAGGPAAGGRADPESQISNPQTIMAEIVEFFRRRIAELAAAGIERDRLILDPGMGLFLGSDPQVSLAVLRGLPALLGLGLPVLISTSRKSFIGAVLGRGVAERGAGTLATEIWAALQGVHYIRTHDVAALRDALTMLAALRG